ncbi:hypothetical protein D3C72_1588670 [compost metagenome]
MVAYLQLSALVGEHQNTWRRQELDIRHCRERVQDCPHVHIHVAQREPREAGRGVVICARAEASGQASVVEEPLDAIAKTVIQGHLGDSRLNQDLGRRRIQLANNVHDVAILRVVGQQDQRIGAWIRRQTQAS